jgi:hypothetical protein
MEPVRRIPYESAAGLPGELGHPVVSTRIDLIVDGEPVSAATDIEIGSLGDGDVAREVCRHRPAVGGLHVVKDWIADETGLPRESRPLPAFDFRPPLAAAGGNRQAETATAAIFARHTAWPLSPRPISSRRRGLTGEHATISSSPRIMMTKPCWA